MNPAAARHEPRQGHPSNHTLRATPMRGLKRRAVDTKSAGFVSAQRQSKSLTLVLPPLFIMSNLKPLGICLESQGKPASRSGDKSGDTLKRHAPKPSLYCELHFLDTEGVRGSNPLSRTIPNPSENACFLKQNAKSNQNSRLGYCRIPAAFLRDFCLKNLPKVATVATVATIMKISVGKTVLRGNSVWVVSRTEGGKRKRSYFSSKGEADAEADRLQDEVAKAGREWIDLPAADKTRLMLLYSQAKDKGLELSDMLNARPTSFAGPNLQKAIEEVIASKTAANRSEDYTNSLRLILTDFAKAREHVNIASVEFSDVESYLDRKGPASRSTLRSRLSALFEFAVRRGWRPDNPCDRLEHVKVVSKPPAIFTPSQFQKCMAHFKQRPRGYAWFVLSTLCGLRPEEAEETRKADINFKEGWIRVEAQTTKVAQRRVVYPRQEALAALKQAVRVGELPLAPQPRRRVIRRLRKLLGWKAWPKDVTRHTCASYWLPVATPAIVSEALGNSEKTLKRHYKALVTKSDAVNFWKHLEKR